MKKVRRQRGLRSSVVLGIGLLGIWSSSASLAATPSHHLSADMLRIYEHMVPAITTCIPYTTGASAVFRSLHGKQTATTIKDRYGTHPWTKQRVAAAAYGKRMWQACRFRNGTGWAILLSGPQQVCPSDCVSLLQLARDVDRWAFATAATGAALRYETTFNIDRPFSLRNVAFVEQGLPGLLDSYYTMRRHLRAFRLDWGLAS